MIDGVEVFAVLMAVIEPSPRDLGELTCAVEPSGKERIAGACIDGPVCRGGGVPGRVDGFAVIEQTFIVAVPSVRFARESVGYVGSPFMVAMDLSYIKS